MAKTVFIYGLNEPCAGPDPTAGRCRYIGKAADPYARYEVHLARNHEEDTYKARWIRSLLAAGKTPILEILAEVPESEWQFWECEWIKLYRILGFRLTNCTDGGDGMTNLPEEVRKKIGDSNRGKKRTPEFCAKLSAAKKGVKFSPEHCANISKTHADVSGDKNPMFGKGDKLKGQKRSLEFCAKISARRKGKRHSPEARANISAHHADVSGGKNPNFGKPSPTKGIKKSAEFCANLSAKFKGVKKSAEHCAKLKEAWKIRRLTRVSEETRAKLSTSGKLRWAKQKGLAT